VNVNIDEVRNIVYFEVIEIVDGSNCHIATLGNVHHNGTLRYGRHISMLGNSHHNLTLGDVQQIATSISDCDNGRARNVPHIVTLGDVRP
jgi:hypothetical protein